ncbi:MAG: flagellar assembly protein FliH [Pseudomonadaceae bacterium]|jgi:flagellar assembly protein FliH|nr:flagellar assembly protein FliH [Pseudomonadaceae bacterium]
MTAKDVPSELIRAKDVRAFDRWALPSFEAAPGDPAYFPETPPVSAEELAEQAGAQSEEIELESVKPLTLDELEAIRQDGYNEGFAVGEKDGFHAGQIKAKHEAELLLQAKLLRLEQLMGQLLVPIAEQDQQIEQALVQLVSHISRQVIRRELQCDSSQLKGVLSEALKLLPMGAGNVRIHINAQDFELVKALRERHEENWRILEDEQLLPGGCRIETEHSQIDASVETRLEQAIKQLFEQQREQATNPPLADLALELSDDVPLGDDAPSGDEHADAP